MRIAPKKPPKIASTHASKVWEYAEMVSWVTYKVLGADVGAVEREGRDRLDVPGRRGQVEGAAAVLRKREMRIVNA